MSKTWARTDFWPSERVDAPVADDYARGIADGRRTVEAEFASDRAALAQMVANLEVLTPPSPEALVSLMLAAVERLVRDIAGAATIDAALLDERAMALAALVAGEGEAVLALHPDDVALLGDARQAVRVIADPALGRGTIEARSGVSLAEDGVGPALTRLHREFLRLGMAA